jgi:hypothetical protein
MKNSPQLIPALKKIDKASLVRAINFESGNMGLWVDDVSFDNDSEREQWKEWVKEEYLPELREMIKELQLCYSPPYLPSGGQKLWRILKCEAIKFSIDDTTPFDIALDDWMMWFDNEFSEYLPKRTPYCVSSSKKKNTKQHSRKKNDKQPRPEKELPKDVRLFIFLRKYHSTENGDWSGEPLIQETIAERLDVCQATVSRAFEELFPRRGMAAYHEALSTGKPPTPAFLKRGAENGKDIDGIYWDKDQDE